jgi:hypothetical protein
MRVLRVGDRGPDVRDWQLFLTGQGFAPGSTDGIFGVSTAEATVDFQQVHSLVPDGFVGNRTLGLAATLGFQIADDESDDVHSANWPPPPDFVLPSDPEREVMWGKMLYMADPHPGNKERIRVTNDWAKSNIVVATVPQLKAFVSGGKIQFHRKGVPQLLALWEAWSGAGLLDRVLSWEGSYAARFIRGSTSKLSNHAYGAAFDINQPWNKLGVLPALVGKKGSVRELVQLANEHGFFWGGHYKKRKDGMHFEIARLK